MTMQKEDKDLKDKKESCSTENKSAKADEQCKDKEMKDEKGGQCQQGKEEKSGEKCDK